MKGGREMIIQNSIQPMAHRDFNGIVASTVCAFIG
jgi:hypothetical protein